ncbi:EthD domain-containing protein [Duganella hordei]|uniref:EthD domain-containing protein n=1 Tax=Duganella hordei TaxID=2865934 RepID=UPI0030EAC765
MTNTTNSGPLSQTGGGPRPEPLKVVLSSARHPSMSRDEFFNHLSNIHAPLVQSMPETMHYVRKYVQNHSRLAADGAPIDTVYPHLATRDSVIELWFDSKEMFLNLMSAPNYAEVVRPDEARFNDLSKLIIVATQEQLLHVNALLTTVGGPAQIKTFDFIKRKHGTSAEDFAAAWPAYQQAFAGSQAYERNVAAHVWNSALKPASNPFGVAADYDGVLETWFQSYDALAQFQREYSATRHLVDLESQFVNRLDSFSVVAEERPIYDNRL